MDPLKSHSVDDTADQNLVTRGHHNPTAGTTSSNNRRLTCASGAIKRRVFGSGPGRPVEQAVFLESGWVNCPAPHLGLLQ